MKSANIGIRFDENTLRMLDELVEERRFKSRSECVKGLIHKEHDKLRSDDNTKEAVLDLLRNDEDIKASVLAILGDNITFHIQSK